MEKVSGEYGLKLNIYKCVNLNKNMKESPKMRGGYRIENVEEATYLGNTMNKKANILEEVDKQIQQAQVVLAVFGGCAFCCCTILLHNRSEFVLQVRFC